MAFGVRGEEQTYCIMPSLSRNVSGCVNWPIMRLSTQQHTIPQRLSHHNCTVPRWCLSQRHAWIWC